MNAKDVVPRLNYGVARSWVDSGGGPSASYLRRSRWQEAGSCADQDTEAWFVRNEASRFAQPAKQICAACPVRRDCLASALLFGEQYGIWGGLDRHQRQTLTQTLRRGATLGAVLDQALGNQGVVVQSARMDAA